MGGRTRSTESGFTAIELVLTLGIMGVVGSLAVIQIGQSLPAMKADGAMRVVIGQLNNARELAITQRRAMQVKFLTPNQIQIVRTDVNTSGAVTGATVLSTVPFEGGITYNRISAIPDTPDAFGMSGAVNFGTATTIQFATDGQLVDQAGSPLNGTVVLSGAGHINSSRAVTVFGSTGRVRGYRWNGRAWVLV